MVNDTCMMLKNEVHLDVRGVYRYARDLWGCHVIRIDTLVLLNAFAYVFLATFGPQRRRSKNWFIQKGTLVANTLSFLLGTYTLGSMQSSKVKSGMYPVWAATLFILHVCTNTAYSLDDNKHVTRVLYRLVFYNVYGGLLLMTAIGNGSSAPLVIILYAVGQYKFKYIQAPCVLASCSWNLNKMVADYMYDEHTKGEFVPTTMKGCHYLVDWPLDNSKLGAPSYASRFTSDGNEVIDIEKIWLCDDISEENELKDTCLSFSLFLLLRRRYFGFACGESKERAHDFVFKGLLRENEEGTTDCNRAFRLIEVELAFMYDFFFTTSAAIYYGSRAATVAALLSVFFLSLTILSIVSLHPSPIHEGDMAISLFILASAALLELLQLLLYWTSIWSRVSFVCQYLREQARLNTRGSCCSCSSWCRCRCVLLRLKGLLAKIGVHWTPNKHYWQHKLGQYPLLDYRPMLCDKFKDYLGRFTISSDPTHASPILHPIDYHTRRVRQKRGKSTEITAEVQKALIYSLKRSNGELTNGKSSLVSNGAGHLLWACERAVHSESDTSCIILTWHIATWYCERGTLGCSPCPDEETELKVHLGVATKLSKYCAYLLVSAPKLLPGHEYDTSCVFDEVAEEARKLLSYVNVRDKYQALKNYGLEESEATIFQSGAKLGKQLEEIEDVTRRWKVLADFWSEMLLYIAPSDNVDEHIEQLTRGGEFITHLWALLSHAGILQRGQPNLSNIRAENSEGSSARHQESEQNSANLEENTQDNSARARHQEVVQDSVDPEEATPLADHPVQIHDNLLSTRLTLQVHSQGVGARPLQIPEQDISTENECHIDVPEAPSTMQQALPEQDR
ncbi:unnamed protein product [Triticum turgidum subsp. durum]|uniref:DUF4220 domain-containing protein n=1 Tax=Triticum turgidum subsp. durum TaxID=4567 RepID=A0A9R1PFK6_TRITD|nr:unnamed protein product [Triticum turgidum subsp. durum]